MVKAGDSLATPLARNALGALSREPSSAGPEWSKRATRWQHPWRVMHLELFRASHPRRRPTRTTRNLWLNLRPGTVPAFQHPVHRPTATNTNDTKPLVEPSPRHGAGIPTPGTSSDGDRATPRRICSHYLVTRRHRLRDFVLGRYHEARYASTNLLTLLGNAAAQTTRFCPRPLSRGALRHPDRARRAGKRRKPDESCARAAPRPIRGHRPRSRAACWETQKAG